MRYIACLTALIATTAMAGDAVVSFTYPTARTDGAALPLSEIQHVLIEAGTCSAPNVFGTKEAEIFVAPPVTVGTITTPGYGDKCYRAYTVDTDNRFSDPTGVISKNFPVQPPNPPGSFVFEGSTAYELKMLGNGEIRLGRNVGTVTETVECGATIVDSYVVVPNETVDFYRTAKSSVVVAECVPG